MNSIDGIHKKVELDRLLSLANASRVKGDLLAAEDACHAALEINADSVDAVELLGDVLHGLGKLDDALDEYRKALEKSSPPPPSVERKYARVALEIADRDREKEMVQRAFSEPEKKSTAHRNAAIAMLLSAVAPGVGQIYNGDVIKGVILAGTFFSAIAVTAFSPGVSLFVKQALSLIFLGSPNPGNPYAAVQWPSVWFTIFLGAGTVAYIYSVVDAPIAGLKRAQREGKDNRTP